MRTLVIGGTRFIGTSAVRRLRARGHEVAVLNRRQTAAVLPEDVVQIRGDRDHLEASRGAIDRFAPDVVVHDIAFTRAHAEHAMAFFRGMVERLVVLSSIDVYRAYGRLMRTEAGAIEDTPLTEEAPLRERLYPLRQRAKDTSDFFWEYDKIPVEQAVLDDEDLPATVLRLPMVLGRGDYRHRLFPFVRPMLDARPAIVLQESQAHWLSTYAHVENIGEAIATTCDDARAVGQVFNLGDGARSLLELGGIVAGVLGWKGELVLLPHDDLPAPLQSHQDFEQPLVVAADRIDGALEYEPLVDLDDAVRHAALWEREHPPAPGAVEALAYDAQDEVLARA